MDEITNTYLGARIAVLHPSYEGSDALFRHLDPACDPLRFLPGVSGAHFNITKSLAFRQITEVARRGFDAVINRLCDGARDEDRAGIEVVQALEQLNVAFTGAGSLFFDPSRDAMKMGCHAAGVKFPAYVTARHVDDTRRALARLRFPMIVKHPQGYSSVGMTKQSRVTDAASLPP